METKAFLEQVVTGENGNFVLLIGPPTGDGWREVWFKWPEELPRIIAEIDKHKGSSNVYFSTHLFSERNSAKQYVMPTRTIQADLDNADIRNVQVAPTVLVETSPGRHQAFWILKDQPDNEVVEQLAKRLTYSIPDCDRSGWALGRKVRVPDTLNFKYPPTPHVPPVRIVSMSGPRYTSSELIELLPELSTPTSLEADDEWTSKAESIDLDEAPQVILARIRKDIPSQVYVKYSIKQSDRSSYMWGLMLNLFRAGLSRDEVFHVARHSANNKFADGRFHALRDLAKDVLRAERFIGAIQRDVRSKIREARKLPGTQQERREYIASIVRDELDRRGQLLRTDNGQAWYLRSDVGRPIQITRGSEWLDSLLETWFGLNASEAEQRFVVHSLLAQAKERGTPARVEVFSSYDVHDNSVMLHLGRRDVLQITRTGLAKHPNGSYGTIFPWNMVADPIHIDEPLPCAWTDFVFDGFFDNIVAPITPLTARTLMRVWMIFLLMRNAAKSRPVLALFGQPGAGKSTIAHILYMILYGSRKSLNAVTTQDDFDFACASDPLVIFDNVDTWVGWLPDRIALAASDSEFVRRKLYTDVDTITLRRQALLGITAHNPKFGREDVVDRMLMLNFDRFTSFMSESVIMDKIMSNRGRIWGSIIVDIQRVLAQAVPRDEEVPKFRISDFAKIGLRIARALDIESDFRAVLDQIRSSQTTFVLGEDDILIDAIRKWHEVRKIPDGTYLPPGAIWANLSNVATDPQTFTKYYRNAVSLGKKLFVMQEALKEVFDISFKMQGSQRTWRIDERVAVSA